LAGQFDTVIPFLLFVCALGSTSLGAIALAQRRADVRLPWAWLATFAFLQAGMLWSRMPQAAAARPVEALSGLLAVAALGVLLEFARQALHPLRLPAPGRWVLLVFLAIWLSAFATGWGASIEILLAAAVASAAGLVLFLTARRDEAPLRRPLFWMAGGLGAQVLAASLVRGAGSSGSPGSAATALVFAGITALGGLAAAAGLMLHALWREELVAGSGLRRIRRRLIAGGVGATVLVLLLGLALAVLSRGATGWRAVWLVTAGPAIIALQALALRSLLDTWRSLRERASRTRLENECLLSAVVETAGDGLLVVDSDGRPVASNAPFLEMMRLTQESLQQLDEKALLASMREQLIAPDEFLSSVEGVLGSLQESLDLLRFKDGRVLRCSSRPLPEGGLRAGRVWLLSDITARTHGERERRERNARLERQSEALLRLAEDQAALYQDREAAMKKFTRIAADSLHVEHLGLWLYGGPESEMQCCWHYQRSADRHLETPGLSFADVPAHREALNSGTILAVTDVRQDQRTQGPWQTLAAARGILSLLDAPVRVSGRIVGMVSFGHVGSPRRWNLDERIFAGCMADCVAHILEAEERQRAEEGLQRAQRFHHQVIETAATPFFMTDDDGRIREVNDAFCSATGYFPEEIVGRHYTVLARERCGPACPLADAQFGGRVSRHRCTIDDKTGRNLDIVLNVSSVEDQGGRTQGRLFSFVDVTEALEARRETDSILRETETSRDQARIARERREALERDHEETRRRLAEAQTALGQAGEELRRLRETAREERRRLEERSARETESAAAEKRELREQLKREQQAGEEARAHLEQRLNETIAHAAEDLERERACRAEELERERAHGAEELELERAHGAEELVQERARAAQELEREKARAAEELAQERARAAQELAREQARADAGESRVRVLEEELARVRDSLAHAEAQSRATVSELREALVRAQGEGQAAERKAADLARTFEETRRAAAQREQQQAAALEEARRAAAQLRGEREAAIQEARQEAARAEALRAELDRTRQEGDAAQRERDGVRGERDATREEWEAARRGWREEEGRLSAALREARTERDRLAGESERLVAEGERLVAERDQLAAERDRLAADCERLVVESSAIAKEHRELVAERERLRGEGQAAGGRAAAGRRTDERARETLAREVESLRAELAAQREALGRATAEAARREEEIARARDEREAAEKQSAALHERVRRIEERARKAVADLNQAHAGEREARTTAEERAGELEAGLQAARDELAALRDRAKDAEAAKGRLLANLSHGIRTPLNAIHGTIDLALAGGSDDEQRQRLESVQASARTLLILMDDLFDLARLESGKLGLEPAAFDLRAVLTTTLHPFLARARQKGLAFTWSFSSEVPESVVGDAARLRQVLINIVGNAVAFTEKGSIEVGVTAVPEKGNDLGLLFSVRDTGVGIAQDRLQALLNASRRKPGAKTRDEEASGLGLTIAGELVRMMGGRIWAESKTGTGSTFHFSVRMGRAEERKARSRRTADTVESAAPAPAPAVDLQAIIQAAGGRRDTARERADVFLKESPRLMARMRQAILGRNAMALGVAAHLLKGAAGNLAAEGARRSAEHIEACARVNDLEGARREIKILDVEVTRVRTALAALAKAA